MKKKDIPVLYHEKYECCACTACYSICAQHAISMVPDEEGFEYPVIDEEKCIKCYCCITVCPFKKASIKGDRDACKMLKGW